MPSPFFRSSTLFLFVLPVFGVFQNLPGQPASADTTNFLPLSEVPYHFGKARGDLADGEDLQQPPYLVNPRIIQALYGYISDADSVITSINLDGGNSSNQFSMERNFLSVEYYGESLYPTVAYRDRSNPLSGIDFSYQYIGTTPNHIHVLKTTWSGGGSASYRDFLLIAFRKESFLLPVRHGTRSQDFISINLLGRGGLGDRYRGELMLDGFQLHIPQDTGWFSGNPGATLVPESVIVWLKIRDPEDSPVNDAPPEPNP